jgi:hypothetical protein
VPEGVVGGEHTAFPQRDREPRPKTVVLSLVARRCQRERSGREWKKGRRGKKGRRREEGETERGRGGGGRKEVRTRGGTTEGVGGGGEAVVEGGNRRRESKNGKGEGKWRTAGDRGGKSGKRGVALFVSIYTVVQAA